MGRQDFILFELSATRQIELDHIAELGLNGLNQRGAELLIDVRPAAVALVVVAGSMAVSLTGRD